MSVLKTKKTVSPAIENAFNKDSKSAINLMIDSDLHERFKIKTIKQKTSMTDVICDFIRQYVSN